MLGVLGEPSHSTQEQVTAFQGHCPHRHALVELAAWALHPSSFCHGHWAVPSLWLTPVSQFHLLKSSHSHPGTWRAKAQISEGESLRVNLTLMEWA